MAVGDRGSAGGSQRALTLNDLQKLTPLAFEEFVKRVFEEQGYTVAVTRRVGDEGVDLVLLRDDERSIAQCKRYRGQVGQPLVREFYGAVLHENAKRGYLVTTGRFSLPAHTWAQGKNITLVDGADLLEAAGHLRTSIEGLPVSTETVRGTCRICGGQLHAASIGTGSVSGVGQPKPNAIQCGNCKAVYELKTKPQRSRRDRFRYFYSCEQDGIQHNLRVAALLYEGHEVRVLRCEKCAAAFDFNGDRIKTLTQFWQGAEAAGKKARAIEQSLRHEQEALVEDMKRFVDWVQKGREESPSWSFPWSRNRDEEAREALAALRMDLPEWPGESTRIMPWVRSVLSWRKPGRPNEELPVQDFMMWTILTHFKLPVVMDYSEPEIDEEDEIDFESIMGQ
jgi:restriction system protein